MRQPITLTRDGQPLDIEALSEGTVVTYHAVTGAVLQIADRDGSVAWEMSNPPEGRTGYMIADRRKKKSE